jgi:hypothetical protein
MDDLGKLFGLLIILFYVLAVLNFCFKFLNRNFRDTLKKSEGFYKIYMKLLKFFVKYHKYFGGAAILMILIHFYLQFSRFGISVTGCIAAGVMLLQVGLGVYGQIKKKRSKTWLMLHRGIAAMLLVAILIHIL